MNKEQITTEDVLNVTGSMFDTMLDYVDNSSKEIEELQQENKQLKEQIQELKADYGTKTQVERDMLRIQVNAQETVCNEFASRIDKLKDELRKDRMEQFDDYVIYLLGKYLEILGGDNND